MNPINSVLPSLTKIRTNAFGPTIISQGNEPKKVRYRDIKFDVILGCTRCGTEFRVKKHNLKVQSNGWFYDLLYPHCPVCDAIMPDTIPLTQTEQNVIINRLVHFQWPHLLLYGCCLLAMFVVLMAIIGQ